MGEDVVAECLGKSAIGLYAMEQPGEMMRVLNAKVSRVIGTEHADVTGNVRAENGNAADYSLGNNTGAAFH